MSHTFWISDKQLDPEQKMAVQNIPVDTSFALRGPAGAGKTNILLLRAKWLKLKKLSEFRIVVFTSSLKNFVQEGCVQYGLAPECVVTSIQLFKNLLNEYHVPFELTNNFETDRSHLAGKVKALLESKSIENTFDALLIDEAQDYMDTELLVFRRLTPRLVLAADSRQSIYRNTHTPGLIDQLVDNSSVTLKYHYRSGLALCSVADGILKDSAGFPSMRGECKYDEHARPSSVELLDFPSFSSQVGAILKRLPSQLALYPAEKIGVLFPKVEQKDEFEVALSAVGGIDTARVWVDTLHGAKGREFRAVHIGGCEALYRMGPTQKRLAYVGILRGKTSATLYYSGSVPGYLESAVAALSPPAPDPDLDALFGA